MNTIARFEDATNLGGFDLRLAVAAIIYSFTYTLLALGVILIFLGLYKLSNYQKQLKLANQKDPVAMNELKRKLKKSGRLAVIGLSLFLIGGLLWLVMGWRIGNQLASQTPPSAQPIEADQSVVTEKSIADELLQYGEGTKRRESLMDPTTYNGPEVGYGELFNDDENKAIDKWYFLRTVPEEKTQGEITKEKYLLIIDDKCLVDAVGFTNGSCLKFLSVNKDIIYDGNLGPSVTIYGKILSDKSIQVSNITIVQ